MAKNKTIKAVKEGPNAVRVGQVWEDCDPRLSMAGDRRLIKVVNFVDSDYALVRSNRGKDSTIRLSRFRPTNSGYRLTNRKTLGAGSTTWENRRI